MGGKGASTILVVDDNPPTRYSTSRVLRSAGFEVIEAVTGRDALAKTLTNPDLIILDVNLPDIDGFEVCRQIRGIPDAARTPVIHLSATFVTDMHKVRGLEAGADGYLTHPVEPPILIATVNAFLRARQAEERMRTSDARFKAVFENALNGIAVLSDEMTYLDVNPAVCDTFGLERQDVIGRPVGVFVPPESQYLLLEIDRGLSASGRWKGAIPVMQASGAIAHLEWSISTHSEPNTRLAVTTDISDRKAIEAERERLLTSERSARGDAERANRLKDDFLAAVSHELRTPLNAILGWARLLALQHAPGDPVLHKGLDAIMRNVRMQTRLIDELMDVSMITSGKLRLERQWFDPKSAVEASLSGLRDAAVSKGVDLAVRIEPNVGQMFWDQARFQQVVANLVDNAIKFSTHGGSVTVSMQGTDAVIQLRVRDNGRGISHAFLPFVFERFRQEDASTKRRHGGLGLGLAIVKQLIQAHHGTIEVASPGEDLGATFTVTLPRLGEAGDMAPAGGAVRATTLAGLRILVVEDDEDAREFVTRVLRDFQADARGAASVSEAKAILIGFKPDLVISDISMPGEDGYDLIEFLRAADSEFRAVPAIALTAFARQEDRHRVLEAGYQQHMTKPVETLKLVELAGDLLEQRRRDEGAPATRQMA